MAVGLPEPQMTALLPPASEKIGDRDQINWISHDKLEREGSLYFRRNGIVLGFDDGLIDNPLWKQKLSALLGALYLVRPERPIDALTVVVPAQLLLEAATPEARRPSASAASGSMRSS